MAPDEIPRKDSLRYMDTGHVDLTTAGKAYKIVTLRGGQAVVIKALVGNSDKVYLGKMDVTASNGFELSLGESLKIEYLPDKETTEYLDLYCVAASSGDDVCFIIIP